MTTAYSTQGGEAFNTQDAKLVSWVLAAGESGDPFVMPAYADRSIQITGTFGGATVTFEGSNQSADAPTVYATLTDPQGNNLSFAAAGLKAVSEMTRVARPQVTGGDGTTALTCLLFVKR